MRCRCNIFIFIFLVISSLIPAQDKLFLKNGQRSVCRIISINNTTIDYKDTTSSSQLFTIQKSDVLMLEKAGQVHIFGSEQNTSGTKLNHKETRINNKKAAIREKEQTFKDGIIGFQPIDLLWGRLTFTYERLFMDKRMGLCIPFTLSFDPRILIPGGSNDTLVNTPTNRIRRNAAVITGLDLNYYYETRSYSKFFFGPRIRYGTDVNLANITGYTVQFQNGFLFCDSRGRTATTFAVGFGFARIISTPFSSGFNEKQSYPWASFTLRIGIRR